MSGARGSGRVAFWSALAVAVAGLAVTVALLTALAWPGLNAARTAQTADGARAFAVAGGAAVAGGPGAGAGTSSGEGAADGSPGGPAATAAATATVTPAAGWSVRSAGDGAVLLSPDRVLEVGLRAVPGAEADAALAAAGEPVLSEVLASGLELRHVTAGEQLVGVLETDDGVVLVEARVDPPAELGDYRPALAELIESIG